MKRALAVFITIIVLAACPSGPPPDENETLHLSGQVYTRNIDIDSIIGGEPDILAIMALLTSFGYTGFNGNSTLNVSDNFGGSGKIENGILSFSTGKPDDAALSQINADALDFISDFYTIDNFTPNDAKAAFLTLNITDSPDYNLITREKIDVSLLNLKTNVEAVVYVYVDKDVIITAQGLPYTDNIMNIPVILTTPNINLKLIKGWNAVYSKLTVTPDLILLPSPSINSIALTANVNILVDDLSSLHWVLNQDYSEFVPYNNYRLP